MQRNCINCNIDITLKVDKRAKFCSRSCSAKTNNKLFPKKQRVLKENEVASDVKKGYKYCKCGKLRIKRSNSCRNCKITLQLERKGNQTISDIMLKNKRFPACKFDKIRAHARRVMALSNTYKACKICKFDLYVEVCHIKPISTYSLDTKLSDVNNLANLVYLCPNHHIMLDKNINNFGQVLVEELGISTPKDRVQLSTCPQTI